MKTFRALSHLRPFSFLILCSLFLISCSVSSKISKSAKNTVLNAAPLKTAHIGISIYDPETGKYLYNYQGDKYFVPASNTKIPTCYAAMKYLGDSLVGLRYSVSKEEDTLISVMPAGDPTFLHPDFKRQPIYDFLSTEKGRITLMSGLSYDKYFGNGWSWNDALDAYMAPRSYFPIYGNTVRFYVFSKNRIVSVPSYFVKNSLTILKANDTIPTVTRDYNNNQFTFYNVPIDPAQPRLPSKHDFEIPFLPIKGLIELLLADTIKRTISSTSYPLFQSYTPGLNHLKYNGFSIIHSQPTDSLLKPMMHRSDNFFAEQSLLMVSNEHLGIMNDAKIIDTLLKTDFKDLPQKPRWADGSGLSRYNLFTPQDFVAILNKMKNEFGMERIKTIFPTGGEGTISSYYKAGSGYIYAKTGTLSGVVALSGFLYTKKGKLLIFSTLVNNHQATSTEVRRAVEQFIEHVRGDL